MGATTEEEVDGRSSDCDGRDGMADSESERPGMADSLIERRMVARFFFCVVFEEEELPVSQGRADGSEDRKIAET